MLFPHVLFSLVSNGKSIVVKYIFLPSQQEERKSSLTLLDKLRDRKSDFSCITTLQKKCCKETCLEIFVIRHDDQT